MTHSNGTVSVTDTSSEAKNVPIEFSAEGILVGDPSATLVDYYFDFSCPHCVEYYSMTGKVYEELIASGKLAVRYHVVSFVSEYSPLAANAAFATAALQPEKFEQVRELLLVDAKKPTMKSEADVAEVLRNANLNLNPEVLQAVEQGAYAEMAIDQTEKATDVGLEGVPSVAVNGKFLPETPTDRAAMETAFGLK